MKKLSEKKIIVTALILICGLQFLLSLYWGKQKDYLFFDEVFSYAAANNVESISAEFAGNQWMDEEWFDSYMGVDSEHRFDYSIPYKNQITDVHPPLFYFFLHTASSFVPEEFSFMAGISFNIVFFIGCTIALYFVGKELFKSKECGLLTGFLYAISFAGLNTMVFIRMYMLMAFLATVHVLVYLKYMEKEEIPVKGYLLLILTLVAGVLTQYYFLFVAFFLGVWYTIKFFIEKRYQTLIKYLMSIAASAGICLAVWPTMLKHLFSGVRGKEAQSNFFALDGYLSDLKEMFRVMNNDLFTKLLPVILVGMLGVFVIYRKKSGTIDKTLCKKRVMVLFVCAGYFFVVTKVAPYQMDRYLMPIYPLVYLLVVGIACELLQKFLSKKAACILCILGFGGLSVIHIVHSGIPYTYVKNPNNIERQALVEEYKEDYALYISDNGECHHFTSAQVLRNYKAFYHVYDLSSVEQTKNDIKNVYEDKELVVYVTNTLDMDMVNEFVQQVFDGQNLDEHNLLDEDEEWNVYLIKLNE